MFGTITRFREDAGLTVEELAAAIGKDAATVLFLETLDIGEIRADNLYLIAKALCMSVDDFFVPKKNELEEIKEQLDELKETKFLGSRQVKFFGLGFENCEAMRFATKDVGVFQVDNVVRKVQRIGMNCISERQVCSNMLVELLPSANDKYMPFGATDMEIDKYARIQRYDDIVSCVIHYDNGEAEEIYLPWREEDVQDCNVYQKTYLSKNGALYVYVGEGDIRDQLNLEEIEDPSYAENFFYDWFE